MAVASQPVPGALRPSAGELHLVELRSRAETPRRWIAPTLVVGVDLAAMLVAFAVAGERGWITGGYLLAALICLSVSGAYRNRMSLQSLDQVPWIVGRLAVPLLALAPLTLLIWSDVTPVLVVALVSAPLVIVGRVLSFAVLRAVRRRGHLLDPTVILGAGEVGAELGRTFIERPEYGSRLVGFLDSVTGNLPAPVLGDMDQLDRLLTEYDVRRVVVAFGPARESELVSVLRTAVAHDADVHIVPRFFDCGVVPQGPDTDDVRGIPLYRVRRAALRAPAWYLKRLVDVVVSGTALLVAAPVLLVVAIAVKLSSPGPLLFRQTRVGQGGREIEVLKLRSLPVNDSSDTTWAAEQTAEVPWIGRFIRRTSIDEVPQLWSVLKGDMSLVGPRPERPFFVRQFRTDIFGYDDRHRVPVGLTGWAQVHGLRGDTSIEERARYDNQYIEHWSIWRDIVVLVRTIAEVVRGAGR